MTQSSMIEKPDDRYRSSAIVSNTSWVNHPLGYGVAPPSPSRGGRPGWIGPSRSNQGDPRSARPPSQEKTAIPP